ncbi:MAG: tetratricopeptide repeat protein [Bacteroidetes bacterium]|nr:tetratricopeptide repeat protein [Bacteroidota bacterium]
MMHKILRLLSAGVVCFFSQIASSQVVSSPVPDRATKAMATYVDAIKARILDDPKKEENLLLEVIALQPDEAAPHYDLARLYKDQKKPELAEEQIKKAISLDGNNQWYQAVYAEILQSRNKFELAADAYRELAKKTKFNQEYILQAIQLYAAANQFKPAIELIDQLQKQVAEGDDRSNFLLFQKQQMYLKLNDLTKAVEAAKQLISNNPNDGKYYNNLAELYTNNNQIDKAYELYLQAVKQLPTDPDIQYGMAQLYKEKKDLALYDEYMHKAILNPEFDEETQTSALVSYLQELASDSVRKRNISIDITSRVVQLHPQSAALANVYGEVLLDNDKPDSARIAFKKAVALDPSRYVAWQRLMFSYTDSKDADSLIRYSEKALRYFPNQAVVHYLNGIGYFNKKEYPQAIKALNRAIEFQPEDNKALLGDMNSMLGDIYHAAGKVHESDSAYDKAIVLNPKNASALNNYAYYLSLRGVRLEDAERMSKKSLDLRPNEATFMDTYGWILYKQGKLELAKDYILKAIGHNPNADGTVWEHLGDVYFKLGDVEKAVESWKRAKSKGTENIIIDKKISDRKIYE